MKIYYKFIKERKLLLQRVVGDWDTELVIDFHYFLLEQKDLKFINKILTDFRGVSLIPALNDLAKLAKLREGFHSNIHRIVHLLDLPDSTAMSMLYSNLLIEKGHVSIPCSTIKEGLKILELDDYTENEMELIFENLEGSFQEFN